jgi:hypothetical protein
LGGSVYTVKRNTESVDVSKETGLEVTDTSMYSTWPCLETKMQDAVLLEGEIFGNKRKASKLHAGRH